MANNFTNYAENAVLNGTAMPATLYAKMHTASPGEDATSSAALTTTRISMTRTTATTGTCTAVADILWSAVANAETIVGISFWDTVGPGGGNAWWYGVLTVSKTLGVGDDFKIVSTDCIFSVD